MYCVVALLNLFFKGEVWDASFVQSDLLKVTESESFILGVGLRNIA